MPRDERPSIHLNRPSTKKSHSSKEWVDHIDDIETVDTRRDILEARSRLGKFTARFVVEAICSGERDGETLANQMLQHINGDQLVDEMDVDPRALKKLAEKVGGKKTAHVVNNSVLREIKEEQPVEKDKNQQQVELLRALLRTMDPVVVKRVLLGDNHD